MTSVHFTETCALEESEQEQAKPLPHLIVQVQTTVAPVQDVEVTAPIQEELAKRDGHRRRNRSSIAATWMPNSSKASSTSMPSS